MEISYKQITYGDLRSEDVYQELDDRYGLLSYEYNLRRKTFLANPLLQSDNLIYQFIGLVDNRVVARISLFPSKVKLGDKIYPAMSASEVKVEKDYRKCGVGGKCLNFIDKQYSNIFIGAGAVEKSIPIHKRLGNTILPIQRFIYRNNISTHFQRNGKTNYAGKIIVPLFECYKKIRSFAFDLTRRRKQAMTVKQLGKVPEWVTEMVLNDGHECMEVHDVAWMQWNLDNNFLEGERNKQYFYGIFSNNIPVGFFLMKERQVNAETGEIIGSIMEWGTANEELLQEADICKLAIEHSAKEVSIIQHTTTDKHTIKLLKRLGFRYGGNEYVSFRDEENRYANSRDINSWRLRYGYADTIFF